MLTDAFPFFNECDILELRLRELYDHVDRFVIVESDVTHKGEPKLSYLSASRFDPWRDKITHVLVEDAPGGDGLPAIRRREMWQRNAIVRGLTDCADDDIVLISDADEIPRHTHLIRELPDGVIVTYTMPLYYYNVNTRADGVTWLGTRAVRVADARALTPHIVRYGIGTYDAYYPRYAMLPDAGWHFSYFGNAQHVAQKMTQFLHQELITPENSDPLAIAERIARGQDVYGRTEHTYTIGPNDDVPQAMKDDPARWAHFYREEYRHGR